MKILKISLISIAVLILILMVAAAIFIKTFDINRFKPQIISQARSALNREVDFERVSLGISLSQGISLKISNLVISESPAFGKGDFLTVKNISLGFDVLGYLLQKKISIPSILIDSPRVTIIRQKDGSLSALSLAKSGEEGKNSAGPAAAPASTPAALPAMFISSLKVNNGTLIYLDHSFEPALELEVSDLNLSVSGFSLTKPFYFMVEGAVLSSQKNIRLEGKAEVNLKTNEFTISDFKATSDLSRIILEKIPASLPMAKGAVLPVSLKGKASLMLKEITIGQKEPVGLTADFSLTDAALKFRQITSPITDIRMNVKITKTKILLDKTSATIGQGAIKCSGVIEDYLARQDFNATADVENLKIQDLIAQDKSSVKAEGVVSGRITLKGQGFSSQALSSNLSGEGKISISKARLKDINVLRTVLDKISVIPGLAEKFEANLPEHYQQELTQKDTVFSDIKLPVTVENGRLLIKDTVVASDEFLFKGRTEVGFDSAFSLEGSFLIPPELSSSMVATIPEMQYLLNQDQQIFIPLKVSGKSGQMQFMVDAEYIAKKLLANQAKTQLWKVLDKAIGGKKPNTESSIDPNAPQSPSDKKSATEELVDSVLDAVFKK